MEKIDSLINALKAGEVKQVLQNYDGVHCYVLVYEFNEFFIEKHHKLDLVGVECVSEDTARFSLTAKY